MGLVLLIPLAAIAMYHGVSSFSISNLPTHHQYASTTSTSSSRCTSTSISMAAGMGMSATASKKKKGKKSNSKGMGKKSSDKFDVAKSMVKS